MQGHVYNPVTPDHRINKNVLSLSSLSWSPNSPTTNPNSFASRPQELVVTSCPSVLGADVCQG